VIVVNQFTTYREATVSAVLPAFNRAATLGRALESVLAQTRAADEVVVVDDGSTDGTDRLVAGFPSVVYIAQENRGVSAARNRGVSAAAGEWVAFLDSDDEWRPEKLQRQLEALERNPGHDVCHTDEIWIRNGRRVNPGRRHAKAGGRIFRRCLPLCAISPSAAMIRRSLLDAVGGFDEALPVCEDYDLWLRICAHHPVLFVDQPLVVKHGGHADQLSRAHWGMDRFRIRALVKILEEGGLDPADRTAAVDTLLAKVDVYLQGVRRRGRAAEEREYAALRERFQRAR
jgi:glycosyltransferase involved in cell wall biosynthesis